MSEWKKKESEITKTLADEVHEFLTKVFNVYFVQLPPNVFRRLETVRDRLIPLTIRVDREKYEDFCKTFSTIFRAILTDQGVPEDAKKLLMELADKTNRFFEARGFPRCVEEIKYHKIFVKVYFKGSPLEKAIVTAEVDGRAAASKETDENGEAVLEVPAGKYTLVVYKHVGEDEYVYEEKPIEVDRDVSVEFKIKESRTLGEIYKKRGGKPLIKEIG